MATRKGELATASPGEDDIWVMGWASLNATQVGVGAAGVCSDHSCEELPWSVKVREQCVKVTETTMCLWIKCFFLTYESIGNSPVALDASNY